jgi:hypothetical protein
LDRSKRKLHRCVAGGGPLSSVEILKTLDGTKSGYGHIQVFLDSFDFEEEKKFSVGFFETPLFNFL